MNENVWGMSCNGIIWQCPDCGESTVDSELGRIALEAKEAEMVAEKEEKTVGTPETDRQTKLERAEAKVAKAEANLEKGEVLCLYTDGITEAGDPGASEFGVELVRLNRAVDEGLAHASVAAPTDEQVPAEYHHAASDLRYRIRSLPG